MKFATTMIRIICLYCITPTQSRYEQSLYSTGNTVYRGVLGCGQNVSGEVIFDPPENAQAYESWTIPVTDCSVTISTCFDRVGDDIAIAFFVQGNDFLLDAVANGGCDGGPGDGNVHLVDLPIAAVGANPVCNGSIDGMSLIRVGTIDEAQFSITGSGNYTLSLECSADCTVCPVDPELDVLQQIEDAKDVSPAPSPVNCTLCVGECDECSIDSSSDDSSSDDAARSELEKVDEHDILYKYEHEQNDNEEKTYLLKVAQSVWINAYSLLAIMIISCALFCVCMHRKT